MVTMDTKPGSGSLTFDLSVHSISQSDWCTLCWCGNMYFLSDVVILYLCLGLSGQGRRGDNPGGRGDNPGRANSFL